MKILPVVLLIFNMGQNHGQNYSCGNMTMQGVEVDFEKMADDIWSKFHDKPEFNKKFFDYKLKETLRKSYNMSYNEEVITHFKSDTSLSASIKAGLAFADLAFWGKVVSKKRAEPTDQCLYYKTTYNIIITKLAFSIYDYDIGDTVEMRSLEGIVGDACLPGGNVMELDVSHYSSFEVDDRHFFALSNTTYFTRTYFKNKIDQPATYNDPLCPRIFTDNMSNNMNHLPESNKAIIKFYERFYKL